MDPQGALAAGRARPDLAEHGPGVPLFHFIKEADGWKLSMWQLMAMTEPTLQKMFVESGQSDPLEWIVSIIEAVSPRRFDHALLDGPPRAADGR